MRIGGCDSSETATAAPYDRARAKKLCGGVKENVDYMCFPTRVRVAQKNDSLEEFMGKLGLG